MKKFMTNNIQYPFNLVNIFFVTLHFHREPAIPDVMGFQIEVQIKVIDKDFPRLQVNIRYRTMDQSPLKLEVELVGLFDYIGDNPEQDHALITDFLRDKGVHMLLPSISQIIRIITGQMGMNPLDIHTPSSINIPPVTEVDVTSNKKE
jgi:preprotein translocase subunit SecB